MFGTSPAIISRSFDERTVGRVMKWVSLNGFQLLSWSLLVYAVSAFLSGATTAIFVGYGLSPGGPAWAAGPILALAALVLLVLSFRRLWRAPFPRRPEIGPVISVARGFFFTGLAVLALAGVLAPVFFYFGGGAPYQVDLRDNVVSALLGVAALTSLASVAYPALRLAEHRLLKITWIATGIGAPSVLGEVFLSFQTPTLSQSVWFLAGGPPPIFWNLPFGFLVGVSALLLWRVYLSLPDALGLSTQKRGNPLGR